MFSTNAILHIYSVCISTGTCFRFCGLVFTTERATFSVSPSKYETYDIFKKLIYLKNMMCNLSHKLIKTLFDKVNANRKMFNML